MKALYIVISVVLGNILRSLRKRPTALLTLANTLLRCSSNVNLKSNMTPRRFWEKVWETLSLLKTKSGWVGLFYLRLKISSWACLLWSGLKLIFYRKAQSVTFFKSSFNSFVEMFTSWTTENNDVSAISFVLDVQFSDKSFI